MLVKGATGRRQAIIWTYAGTLLFRTVGTNFSEILSEINTYSIKKKMFENVVWKMAAIYLGLNAINFRAL